MTIPPTSRPRSAGITYALLTVALLVVLATLTLTAQQPSPPTIAEFAPQATEQITDSPDDQSYAGKAGVAAPTPTPSPVPEGQGASATTNVPRVRKCVGDPPRQIEDPQSPPCVPYWEGDNGGDTWKGVTRDQINIVSSFTLDTIHPYLESFFNKRFEFYGRKIRIVTGDNGGGGEQAQRAEAVRADEERHAFASLHYHGNNGFQYNDELARRGIIGTWGYAASDEASMVSRHPQLWQYHMPLDRMLDDLGTWACTRLAHRPAIHAGTADMQSTRRRFGIVMERLSSDPITPAPLTAALGRCGEQSTKTFTGSRVASTISDATNVVLQLQEAKVTSVFCFCVSQISLSTAATSQRYFPEWIVSSFDFLDSNYWLRQFTPEQGRHVFGVTYQPRNLRLADEPPSWALREMGSPDNSADDELSREYLHLYYRGLLMVASGIQLAGPRLTPDTFARGLQRARFPNPASPLQAGAVGFDEPDHAMTKDGAEFWWGVDATGPYRGEGSGTMCYVDGGRRHSGPGWTGASGDDGVFFAGPCDSGA